MDHACTTCSDPVKRPTLRSLPTTTVWNGITEAAVDTIKCTTPAHALAISAKGAA